MSFTFNELTPTEFEEFCFDLLKSLDFVNLDWRKGTGLKSSPSDQGRDIQGELLKTEIDGNQYFEKWFIECKHYKKGVPPEKLQSVIAWAQAEKPDVLLIIVSNFLSNPAKTYISQLENNNLLPCKIKYWEIKTLESITAEKNDLRLKYNLSTDIEFLPYLNKYHLNYSIKPQMNTVEYFIELMNQLEKEKRDEAFHSIYFDFIRPRFKPPTSEHETIEDMMMDQVNYDSFRSKCLKTIKDESVYFVQHTVNSALSLTFHLGDITSEQYFIKVQENFLNHLQEEMDQSNDKAKIAHYQPMIEIAKSNIEKMPSQVKRYYEIYNYLCEELVRKLLSEKPKIEIPKFNF